MDPVLRQPYPWEIADEVLRAPTPEEWRARQDENQSQLLTRWQGLEAQTPNLEDVLYGFGPGAGMAIAGKIPLTAGALLFKQRPWMRDIVAKVAGKKWLRKYMEEQPGTLAKTAKRAIADYEQATGSPMATYGLEYEVRSPKNLYELQRDIPRQQWDIKGEVMGEHPWESRYRYPMEAATGTPYEGREGLNRFLSDLKAFQDPENPLLPMVAGGKHGGGLHIHQSSTQFRNDPEILKRLTKLYLEEEPFLFPPVPSYKQGPRSHVDPLLKVIRAHPEHFERFLKEAIPGQVFSRAFGKGPGLSARPDFRIPHVEYRHQYAANPLSRAAEDILVAQSLLDRARQAKYEGEGVADFVGRLYDEIIGPRKQEILDIQKNKWFPREGIHEQWSPFTNGLLEKPALARWQLPKRRAQNISRERIPPFFGREMGGAPPYTARERQIKSSSTIEELFNELGRIQVAPEYYGREMGGSPRYAAWQEIEESPPFHFLSRQERTIVAGLWRLLRTGQLDLSHVRPSLDRLNLPSDSLRVVEDRLVHARNAWLRQQTER